MSFAAGSFEKFQLQVDYANSRHAANWLISETFVNFSFESLFF